MQEVDTEQSVADAPKRSNEAMKQEVDTEKGVEVAAPVVDDLKKKHICIAKAVTKVAGDASKKAHVKQTFADFQGRSES